METQAKRDFLVGKWDDIVAYLSVHSVVDCIFVPPGIGDQNYTNQENLTTLAWQFTQYIKVCLKIIRIDRKIENITKGMGLDLSGDALENVELEENNYINNSVWYRRNVGGFDPMSAPWVCDQTTLGEAAGGADDWAMLQGANYSYTLELPPDHFKYPMFATPPHLILPYILGTAVHPRSYVQFIKIAKKNVSKFEKN